MKRLILFLILFFAANCLAAMPAGLIYEFRTTATANMVNGGGYSTGGTDYSQQNSAQWYATDLACTAASTTVTSATGGFTSAAVGNVIHITAGTNFTVGWYHIQSYTNSTTLVLDRSPAPSADGSSGTYYIGGSLNAGGTLEDEFFEQLVAGNWVYIKGSGNYTISESILIGTAVGTIAAPITVEGYKTTRGDNPTGSNMPTLALQTYAIALTNYFVFKNFIITGTATSLISRTGANGNNVFVNIKGTNSSTTANRSVFDYSGGTSNLLFVQCELSSTLGNCIKVITGTLNVVNCYLRDSDIGISATGNLYIVNNVIDNMTTTAISSTGATLQQIFGNTLYGSESKKGTGISLDSSCGIITNNILYGFVTGITALTGNNYLLSDYNCLYNNTTNYSNVLQGDYDVLSDPLLNDPANGDFTLKLGSPCLDAGVQIGAIVGAVGDYKVNIGADQDDVAGGGATSYGFVQ